MSHRRGPVEVVGEAAGAEAGRPRVLRVGAADSGDPRGRRWERRHELRAVVTAADTGVAAVHSHNGTTCPLCTARRNGVQVATILNTSPTPRHVCTHM